MTSIHDLPTPCLVIDLDKLESNIQRMAERARRLGVALRPHFKTHKCLEIARLQSAAGCRGFTVSTLYEARVLAEHGFEDLTWAFPIILNRLPEVRRLAEQITLRLVVDSEAAIEALEGEAAPHHVWLKVDCGYHRAGVDPSGEEVVRLVARLAESSRLVFDGLLTHAGHSYNTLGEVELLQVAAEERRVMVELAARLRDRGLPIPAISVGSTPTMSVVDDLSGVDEIRPGNYVLYDFTQVMLGACEVGDCAATVLASVVSAQPGSRHCVVDAGALALSKDPGPTGHEFPTMGEIFADHAAGRLDPELRLQSLSQEHGILSRRLEVGERLRILPNHSCLTVACFDESTAARGENVVGRFKIWRGR